MMHSTMTNKREASDKLEVVLCAFPMFGHFMPLIPYAAELERRGHSVTLVHEDHPKYRRKLYQCGLTECRSVTYSAGESIFDCMTSYYAQKQSSKPDVVVYDFFAADAADVADSLHVPAIGVFPNPRSVNPWAATVEEQQSYQWWLWCKLMWVMERLVLSNILSWKRNYQRWKRNLPLLSGHDVYPNPRMPRHMIGCSSPLLEFPNLPPAPKFHMVGPALPAVTDDPLDDPLVQWLETQEQSKKKIVYLSFGTMYKYTEERVRELEQELASLGEEVAVLWSLPEQYQGMLDSNSLPSNWMVRNFVPQVAFLQSGKVDVFVTHCGSNSVYEALLSGVPLVCCPGSADQPANATRLARAGVGVIARGCSKGTFGVAVALRHLLENYATFKETSATMAKALVQNNAASRAASLMEDLARGNLE